MTKTLKEPSSTFINPAAKLRLHSVKNTQCLRLLLHAGSNNTQPLKLMMASRILHIHAHHRKRLGAYKIIHVLQRDYGIHISVGRVHRLMKSLQLPKMSTDKPFHHHKHNENGECTNHLQQDFNQKVSNLSGPVTLHISK